MEKHIIISTTFFGEKLSITNDVNSIKILNVIDIYICYRNARKYGHTEKQADKCDEINNPICKTCPFICK